MSEKSKPFSIIVIVAGALVTLVGAGFAVMYVLEGVIATIGEADRSPLFWYLPILFLGIAGISLGAHLIIAGLKSLRKR